MTSCSCCPAEFPSPDPIEWRLMRKRSDRLLPLLFRFAVAACLFWNPAPTQAQATDEDGPARIETQLGRLLESGAAEDLAALAPAVAEEDLERFSTGYFLPDIA